MCTVDNNPVEYLTIEREGGREEERESCTVMGFGIARMPR